MTKLGENKKSKMLLNVIEKQSVALTHCKNIKMQSNIDKITKMTIYIYKDEVITH